MQLKIHAEPLLLAWPEGREGPRAPSSKLQAALTMDHGYNRINLEREEIMTNETEEMKRLKSAADTWQLQRIADAIEEILRIVKKDMEPKKK